MENIFEMPILEQMYYFRREDIEQTIYEKESEIRNIEDKIFKYNAKLIEVLEEVIPNKKDFEKIKEMIQNYDLKFSEEVDFWSKAYYKLGMNDMFKLKCELKNENPEIKKEKTFLDYVDGELEEYMQEKLLYKTENYQAYKDKLKVITEKYPRVLKVHEDSTPIVLNEEEMIQLMELKELDAKVRAEEVKTNFKMGIKEVLNFLHKFFDDCFSKLSEQPDWIKDVDFYTDNECKKEISNLDKKIEELRTEKNKYEKMLEENLKYKSILYESGDVLSKQINDILSEIFEYDNFEFIDEYEEDGRIKLDDVTFIIETKGLNNEISGHNISDAYNHLIIYEDKLDENNITENAKCLFFVAYERNKPLNERTAIKDRIKKIAKANNTLIIDTRVFLNIFEDFLNKKITKEEIKELFIENNGILLYTVK